MNFMNKSGIAQIKVKSQRQGYYFTLPIVVMLAALIIYPMVYGFYISFFNTNLVTKWNFVGFKYYIAAFKEAAFYQSVMLTTMFMILVVAGHFILGFILATLLNREFKGRTVFRVIFMLPWFFPEAVVALLFTWIMNPMYGILNSALKGLGLISTNISWLGSKELAFPAVVFVCIWKGFPLVMTMILAGLQSISKDYYEAAKIDGASKLAQFRYITVPSLKPILTTVLILDCVWWFKQYTLVYTMTAGGPGTATNLISLSIYGTAFNDLRFGKASAWGILVFFICYLISLVSKVVTKENE
ncbi:carbohydrate ABC transporter permease [Lacrimispora sphenoides]|uniref:Multiple sugar transport system permease protein n=1 Tax=Lacrimispora sphenoides JCM 1415 TaxID=1297793 RepID=A0ABY1CHW5_9FIRM|nr:sugar ABC transporter permease [Lacrimispora sphenoides]SEU05768.1 multiple sugar transport system permease protein [[Clostridium] sphenoides JCM 1415]SUY49043.1 binding-protein-dependent transport system inner membrane protein [Lacrimispora sphenoides]